MPGLLASEVSAETLGSKARRPTVVGNVRRGHCGNVQGRALWQLNVIGGHCGNVRRGQWDNIRRRHCGNER